MHTFYAVVGSDIHEVVSASEAKAIEDENARLKAEIASTYQSDLIEVLRHDIMEYKADLREAASLLEMAVRGKWGDYDEWMTRARKIIEEK